jgi:hypothetical protein
VTAVIVPDLAALANALGVSEEQVRRDLANPGKLVELPPEIPSALVQQIGGDHYRTCAIQPVEFIEANRLQFLEGCVVKRVTRHDKPTGKGRQDIEKAIHELRLLLELRYAKEGEWLTRNSGGG